MRVTLKQAAERIRRSLPANGGSGVTSALRGGRGKAAVLVPLFEDNQDSQTDGLSVWLTKRSSTKVSTHRGEIAFPGGKAEEKETPEETARREAKEEVGLGSEEVEILRCMPPLLSKHMLEVTPVLASVRSKFVPKPQTEEVDLVFKAPLSQFLEGENHHSKLYYHGNERHPYTVHFFEYHDREHDEMHVIWGLTAYILIKGKSLSLSLSLSLTHTHTPKIKRLLLLIPFPQWRLLFMKRSPFSRWIIHKERATCESNDLTKQSFSRDKA